MVEHKDVILGLLGASAAIAALVLVFLGLVVTAMQGLPADPVDGVRTPFRVAGALSVAAFLLSLLCAGMSTWWLVGPQGAVTYVLSVVTFLLTLGLLVAIAVWTLWRLIMGS